MNNRKHPIEDEFFNSTVYHVAGKVAEGLNKAASEVTKAVNNLPKNNRYNRYGQPVNPPPYYPPPVQPQQPPRPQQPRPQQPRPQQSQQPPRPQQPPPNYSYNYNYQYNNPVHKSSQKVPPQGYPRPVPAPQIPKDKKKGRVMKQILKFGFAAAFCATYFLTGNGFYRWEQIAAVAGIGLAGYLVGTIVGKIIYRKKKTVAEPATTEPKKQEAPKAEPTKPKKSTGNPELDKIIDDGDNYIAKLRAANVAIKDEGVSSSIDRMEAASKGIFEFVTDHPDQIPQIKKFMNYYLPTTLKLLNSYEKLSKQTVKGENISATMFDIEGMVQTIATAFEKQLDGLFGAEAMDIQADITVFETILKQEGLKDDENYTAVK